MFIHLGFLKGDSNILKDGE